MEIKGEEFLKKVKIRQEKEELEERINELNHEESKVYSNTENVIEDETIPSNDTTSEFDLNISQDAKNAYDNIMLDETIPETTNPDKKKNYLILGLILIVLFLVTILVFSMFMGGDSQEKKDDGFTTNNTQTTKEEQTVDSNFQKIMNEKKKRDEELNQEPKQNLLPRTQEPVQNNPMSDEAMNETINLVKQKEQEELSETQKIIRDIEEKQNEPVKPIIVEKPKKEVVQPKQSPVKNLVKNIETTAPKGYFVQVGAFTKTPSQNYINNIKKANLKYKVYSVEVNGVLYNKVLIGPYSSRAQAKQDIANIKKKLNLSSAFVLKF